MPNPRGVNQYTKGGGGGSKATARGASSKAKASSPRLDKNGKSAGSISRADAAAIMFGRGSKQHKAAVKRFGK